MTTNLQLPLPKQTDDSVIHPHMVYAEELRYIVTVAEGLQNKLWEIGVSWHNNVTDTHCPDMSCCGNVPWSAVRRNRYLKASPKVQSEMRDASAHTTVLLKTVLTKQKPNPVDPLYKLNYIQCPNDPEMMTVPEDQLPIFHSACTLQIELWKMGYSWHNNVIGECCPDMSCCGNTI